MSSKVGKRPLRSLSAHEKMDAIRRVHDGESKASVARDIGVPESTLRGWCKNEDKILYLSRQSTPDTDDSDLAPKEKKPRYDEVNLQPYNLSVRGISKSPQPAENNLEEDSALNLTKPTNLDKNKQELQKLGQDLNLKHEFTATSPNLPSNLTTNLTPNLSSITPNLPTNLSSNITNLTNLQDLSTITANLGMVNAWNNSLLQVTNNLNNKKYPVTPTTSQKPAQKTKKQQIEDNVWYWLKTQEAMLGLVQNQQQTVDPNSSWFWKWYKQLAYFNQQPTNSQEKPILYQQLTKDNTENLENKTKTTKVRAVLDNLLLNNNNNNDVNGVNHAKDEPINPISTTDALNHGETFLKWLEKCGDPSVTAVQILQFRYLLNNVKANVERKNGSENVKKNRSRK